MRLSHSTITRRLLPVNVCLLVLLLTPCRVFAPGRATPEQMKKLAAEKGDEMLADPVTNRQRIEAILIRPGAKPRDELRRTFTEKLAAATTPDEKASLQYLISRTYYWEAFGGVRSPGAREAMIASVPLVMEPALASCEAALAPGATPPVREAMISDMRRILGTSLYGESLPPELKTAVVKRFIDPLEKVPGEMAKWPPQERLRVYSNLGITARLLPELSVTPPKDREQLLRLMYLAGEAFPERALVYAQAYEAACADGRVQPAEGVVEVLRIYLRKDRPLALNWLQKLATLNPWAGIGAFRLICDPAFGLSVAETDQFINQCLAAADQVKDVSGRCQAYDYAAMALLEEKRYAQALACVNRILAAPLPECKQYLASLYYVKGKSLLEQRQFAQAKEALEKSTASLNPNLGQRDIADKTRLAMQQVEQALAGTGAKTP